MFGEFDQNFTKFGENNITTFSFTKFCDIINTGFFTKFGENVSTLFLTKKKPPKMLTKISPNLVKKSSQHLVSPNLVKVFSLDISPNLVIPPNFHQIW